jgi:hypothetical protein
LGTRQLFVKLPDENIIPVLASLQKDGSVAILIINRDPDKSPEVPLYVTGYHPSRLKPGG